VLRDERGEETRKTYVDVDVATAVFVCLTNSQGEGGRHRYISGHVMADGGEIIRSYPEEQAKR